MKYYDIEIFKYVPHQISFVDVQLPSYDDILEIYCPNDRYFLKRLRDVYIKYKDSEDIYKSILTMFYWFYIGDPKDWLNHTMDIIYLFGDMETDAWLIQELGHVITNKPLKTGGQIVAIHIKEIENAPFGKQKILLEELSAKYQSTVPAIKEALKRTRKK